MPLLNSSLLLRSHSLLLIVSAYLLLTSPNTLLSATPLWILGESMHIRAAAFQPAVSPLIHTAQTLSAEVVELLGVLAVVLAVMGGVQGVLAGDLDVGAVMGGAGGGLTGGVGQGKGKPDRVKLEAEERALGESVHTLHQAQTRWLAVAFARVVGMGGLAGWMYVFHAERGGVSTRRTAKTAAAGGGFGTLANRVVFTVGMMDMLFWGYLWTVLREEKREVAGKVARWREERDEDSQ